MTERYVPPAHQTASFDQAYADGCHVIDNLINLYRRIRAESILTRELDIAGFAGWMVSHYDDQVELCELLAIAVVRLAEQNSEPLTQGDALLRVAPEKPDSPGQEVFTTNRENPGARGGA